MIERENDSWSVRYPTELRVFALAESRDLTPWGRVKTSDKGRWPIGFRVPLPAKYGCSSICRPTRPGRLSSLCGHKRNFTPSFPRGAQGRVAPGTHRACLTARSAVRAAAATCLPGNVPMKAAVPPEASRVACVTVCRRITFLDAALRPARQIWPNSALRCALYFHHGAAAAPPMKSLAAMKVSSTHGSWRWPVAAHSLW
jgi:hypothetical protein